MHRLSAEAPVAFPIKILNKIKREWNEEEKERDLSSSLSPSLPPYDIKSPLRKREQITVLCYREHGVGAFVDCSAAKVKL